MGMPPSTFFSELTEGLTLFFSIMEMVLLVTPARLASSRWDRPLSLRMVFRRVPTSKVGILQEAESQEQQGVQEQRIVARLCIIFNALAEICHAGGQSVLIAARYPVQVAEQLVGNGPRMTGHLARTQPLAPQPYMAAQTAGRQVGQIHGEHVHRHPPDQAGALTIHQHRGAIGG